MPSWTSQILKTTKKVITGLLVLTVVWFLMRFINRMISKAMGKKTVPTAQTDFKADDIVKFSPTLGLVNVVDSDKTVDAIIKGQFGPAVVMYHAEWCTHCKNMSDAFESAASLSRVPFVKVQGQNAPVTSQLYGITGYPTILGIMSTGGVPRRFAAMRTKEALLEFAMALVPGTVASQVLTAPTAVPAVPTVPTSPTGPIAAVAQTVAHALAPDSAVVEPLAPTVRAMP